MKQAISIILLTIAATAFANELSTFKTTYHKQIDTILADHVTSYEKLSKEYTDALSTLYTVAIKAGDLNSAKAATIEIERFKADNGVDEKSLSTDSTIRRNQQEFIRRAHALEQDKTGRILKLSVQYDEALLRLQQTLTKQQLLDDATAVQNERTALEKDPVVSAAKADLSSSETPSAAGSVTSSALTNPKVLAASPHMRGEFRPSERERTLCLTFENGLNDKIEKPTIKWEGAKEILDGRFGKGCRLRDEAKLMIGPVQVPDQGTFAIWCRIPKEADLSQEMRLVDSNGLGIVLKGGKIHASFFDGKAAPIGSVEPTLGEWMHLGVTWGKDEKHFYVNGRQHATAPYAGKPGAPVRTIHIGCRWTGEQNFFTGDLDDILMYDRCIDPKEMAAAAATTLD